MGSSGGSHSSTAGALYQASSILQHGRHCVPVAAVSSPQRSDSHPSRSCSRFLGSFLPYHFLQLLSLLQSEFSFNPFSSESPLT